MATGGTISGGSYDTGYTNYNWIVRGFALKPTINNYRLDLEVRWTTSDYDETNEYLCIYGGTQDSEELNVDVWNGVWTNVISGLSAGWNNVSVSSYLTSSNFEIRFVDTLQSGDTSQSSWQVEGVLLHTWSVGTNYQVDFEYQWTAAVFNMVNEQVCIYVTSHSGGSENLLVKYWADPEWSLLGIINGIGWFNFTTAGLSSSTYTIQLKGALESSDTSRDSWNIDVIILHTWDTFGGPHGHGWTIWSDASNPDTSYPWSWSFNFPDGGGYYEFYSIGKYGINTETAPSFADAICYFISANVSHLNPNLVYDNTGSSEYILSASELTLLAISDNSRYQNDDTWYYDYYDSERIEFNFPDIPHGATVSAVTLNFEWRRDSTAVTAARLRVYDGSSWDTYTLTLGSSGTDVSVTLDLFNSPYSINTAAKVNALWVWFQALSSDNGYTSHDWVQVDVIYSG